MLDFAIPPHIVQTADDETKQLPFADAAKVFAVLKVTLEKLQLVGVIPVDPQQQAMVLTKSVGEEIASMINQQRLLEKEFEALIREQHLLRNVTNKVKKEENEANIALVAQKLRKSIEQLCEKLKDNPNVAENMAKVASERQQLQTLFNKGMDELIASKRMPCIAAMVSSELHKAKEMRDVVDREKMTTRAVGTLRTELKDEKEDHEAKVKAYKGRLVRLKEDIRDQNKTTYIEEAHAQKELTANHERHSRLEDQEVADLRKELDILQKRVLLEEWLHQALVDQLGQMQRNLNTEATKWQNNTREDSAQKENELEKLKQLHKQAIAKRKELEKEHQKELTLKMQRDLQAKEELEAKHNKAVQLATQSAAAARIQAYWRGYKVRQGAKGAGKGKKGKKGKKK